MGNTAQPGMEPPPPPPHEYQVSRCTLGEYTAPPGRPGMGADNRAGSCTSTARGLSSRTGGIHAAVVDGRTCIHAVMMDPAGCGLGIQGILCPNLSGQTAEASVPRDHGYQQLGNYSANPLMAKNTRGTGTAGARAVSHAPGSGSVRQPFGGASQVSRQGSGDLLCMGDNHRVHIVQRKPPIYPAGHGPDRGAGVLGMVGKGTLKYPTGGPTGAPPQQTGTNCHCGTLCTSEMSSIAPATT